MPYSSPAPQIYTSTYAVSFTSGNDWEPGYVYTEIQMIGGSAGGQAGFHALLQELVDLLASKPNATVTATQTYDTVVEVTPTPPE